MFLGKRECVAYIKECNFDDEKSYYDDRQEIDFGIMFHSFIYPTPQDKHLKANLSHIIMKNGVIEYERPENCKLHRVVREMEYTPTLQGLDFVDRALMDEEMDI